VKTLLALALGAVALGGSSPAPARVQIVAKEYSYSLSRLNVKAGTAILELDNLGQDPHDLRVQRVGSKHVAKLGKVAPGTYSDLTVHLPPGRYLLWCSIANHRKKGMHATLIVTR
jgi:plastocyanin